MITTSAFQLASRFIGTHEVAGTVSNPAILAMLQLDSMYANDDSVPWCSAFCNYIAWLLGLQRSKSLAARSWLTIGTPITIDEAIADCDIVILQRGIGEQPGPDVIAAPGHVGFYAGIQQGDLIKVLGGNQSDSVSIKPYSQAHILGLRRLEIQG